MVTKYRCDVDLGRPQSCGWIVLQEKYQMPNSWLEYGDFSANKFKL